MDLPANVSIHNALLGMKGAEGVLLSVRAEGCYELTCPFGGRQHRLLLPVDGTVIIAQAPEELVDSAATPSLER